MYFNKTLTGFFKKPIYGKKYKSINTYSWFDIKASKSNNFLFRSTDIKNDKKPKDNNLRAHKVIIYPNKIQKEYIQKWFEICRIVYNQTVLYCKKNSILSFYKLRSIIKKRFSKKFKSIIKKKQNTRTYYRLFNKTSKRCIYYCI